MVIFHYSLGGPVGAFGGSTFKVFTIFKAMIFWSSTEAGLGCYRSYWALRFFAVVAVTLLILFARSLETGFSCLNLGIWCYLRCSCASKTLAGVWHRWDRTFQVLSGLAAGVWTSQDTATYTRTSWLALSCMFMLRSPILAVSHHWVNSSG